MRTGGAATGGDRGFGGRIAVGAGDALSRQFVRACQVGGAKVGDGGISSEHVRPKQHTMSSSEGGEEARDPDFASPDPTGKGKRKVTGEERSEGVRASQEPHLLQGNSSNHGARKGKGKRKLHVEDDQVLLTGLHRDSIFYPSPVEARKSRSKRNRLPVDTVPGTSSAPHTIELPESPMPAGEDQTSRRSARVRYERGTGAAPTDTADDPTQDMAQALGRNTEGTRNHDSSVQAMVTRLHRPSQRRDSRATFGHDREVEGSSAVEEDSSTGRAPAANPRSNVSLPEPGRRGNLRRGFSPSSSFTGASYRIRGNPSMVPGPSVAAAGLVQLDNDSPRASAQGHRHRDLDPTASASGSGFVNSSAGVGFERFGSRRARRQLRTHPPGADQDLHARAVTLDASQVAHVPFGASHAPINLDDIESPRGESRSVIELEDEPSGSAHQLAVDERMARDLQARELQASLNGPHSGATAELLDAQLARALQAQENNRMRLFTRPFFPNVMEEYARHRHFHPPRRHRDRGASWRSRPDRHGLGAALADDAAGSSVRFPSNLSLEMRLEVLAALESAFQDHLPVSLRLAQVDRDFNENDYEMLLALDENNRRNGASAEHIQQLPVTVLQPTDISDEACAVCLEVPVVGDHIRRLPCMHSFHQQCIDKWLQAQAVCPVCKAHI